MALTEEQKSKISRVRSYYAVIIFKGIIDYIKRYQNFLSIMSLLNKI